MKWDIRMERFKIQMIWRGRLRYRIKKWSYTYHKLMRKIRQIKCPACNNRDFQIATIQKPFWVERCKNCGLGRTFPIRTVDVQESEHSKLYSRDIFITEYMKNYAPYLEKSFRRGLARLSHYAEPGSELLDVGCGFGYFLNLAREAGYAVEGIEMSKILAQEGKERFNINISPGSISEIQTYKSYDILTAWDMLEHVIEIKSTLRKFRDCIRPGGLLLLRVPDFSFAGMNLSAGFYESYITMVYPLSINQHYYHFNKDNLSNLVTEAGFKVLEVWPSQEDEYTPRDIPEYLDILKQMRYYGISCEFNLIAINNSQNASTDWTVKKLKDARV